MIDPAYRVERGGPPDPLVNHRRQRWFWLALAWICLAGCDPGSKHTPAEASFEPASNPDAEGWFEDVTAASGVIFQHVAQTNYAMQDQVGSGIALLDYDQDGRLDVYLVQNGGAGSGASNRLFHQEADGRFRDVSDGSGLEVIGRGMGAFAGDLNNDGFPEVILTEDGRVRLFHNSGRGTFTEVAGADGIDNPHWAAPASLLDYDRDGWLDVVIGNYVDYDPTQVCLDVQGRHDFCAPGAFGGTVARLWRNVTGTAGGSPRLKEVTEAAGLTRATGAALGLVCADFDGDGWPDIFISDDGRPNRLFINGRDGTFTEEALVRGVAFNAMGATAANMGTAFADFDRDGMADLFVTHLAEEFHSLWRQHPRGLFIDQVAATGLLEQAWRGTGFGTVLMDFDQDGNLDLAIANGLVRRAVPGQKPVMRGVADFWARYAQRAQLFSNDGKRFHDRSASNPAFSGESMVGRSLAAGDLDNDGAMDLILAGIGGPVRVYRNIAPGRGHWLSVRLVDPGAGRRDAIGAEVVVRAGGVSRWAVLQPATSYLASNDPRIHFGLGRQSSVDAIEVVWPDGNRESFGGGAADRFLVLAKGDGSALSR